MNDKLDFAVIQDRVIDSSDDATAVIFEPTQGVMAVGYASGTIRLFSDKLPTGIELSTGMNSEIRHLAALPGHPALAAVDGLGMLWVFDTDILKLCFSYKVPLAPTCVGLITGTSWLLIGTEAGRLYFVDIREGRKSDFSIGCQVRPQSPVVSAIAHPTETEKLLIAYAEGTCVVCDLGKASVSEKAMAIGQYRLEHHRVQKQHNSSKISDDLMLHTIRDQRVHRDSAHDDYYSCMEPGLTGTSWSPCGSLLAAAYDDGTVCVFDAESSNTSPIATSSVLQPNNEHSYEELPDSGGRYVGNIIWCTLANSDQTFILVTSGISRSSQRYIGILETGSGSAQLKRGIDIVPRGFSELTGAADSLSLLSQNSTLSGGGDGVYGVAMVNRRKRHTVQALQIGPDMTVREMTSLPDEIVWCNYHAVTIDQSQDKAGLSICALLQECLTDKITVPADQSNTQHLSDIVPIGQLIITVDTMETLRLWCNTSPHTKLAVCDGLILDLEYVSSMLGIDYQNVASIDLNANNGLMALALDTGEVLLCALTDNPQLSVAQRNMPLCQIRDLAQEFYADRQEMSSQQLLSSNHEQPAPTDNINSADMPWPGAMPPLEPRNTHSGTSSMGVFAEGSVRDRAASIHEGHLFRRSSKRLSSSIGSIFRRGSVFSDSTGNSAKRGSDISTVKVMRSSNLSSRSSYSTECKPNLPRPVEIDGGVWKSMQAKVNDDLSQNLYGLSFSMGDICRIGKSNHNGLLETTADTVKTSGSQQDCDGTGYTPLKPLILPFMLGRFFSKKVIDVVSGPNGIVAIAFEDGVIVVIDCVKQEVVLADNINQPPEIRTEARDIFGLPTARATTATTAVSASKPLMIASITSVSICEIQYASSQPTQGSESNSLVESLAIGTSLGYVLLYSIHCVEPPALMAVRSGADDSILLVCVDGSVTPTTNPDQSRDQASMLVICSQTAITMHRVTHPEPLEIYELDGTGNRRFIAANLVTLTSGWHGVAGIDSQWNVTLLKLPDLNEEAVINIVNASGLTPSIADEMATTKPNVRVSRTGRILVTRKDGLFMQASIIDMRSPASADAASAVASEPTRKMTRTYFDIAHQLPPPPARKGITSWLFGKSANASADITAFLGSHSRDLIVNGATKPGERFMIRNEKATADEALAEAGPSGISKQTDSKIEGIVKDTELGPFSDMRMMAERRGQQLEELGDKTQRLTGESQKFLENIRAYNAKQKNKKLFGFF